MQYGSAKKIASRATDGAVRAVAAARLGVRTPTLPLATYDTGDTFDQGLAKGFVELWGLPSKTAALRDQRAAG